MALSDWQIGEREQGGTFLLETTSTSPAMQNQNFTQYGQALHFVRTLTFAFPVSMQRSIPVFLSSGSCTARVLRALAMYSAD